MLIRLNRIEYIGLDDFVELMETHSESVTLTSKLSIVETAEFIAFATLDGDCVRVNLVSV